jgi:drug/metabolite transporter (DMT)-like permease
MHRLAPSSRGTLAIAAAAVCWGTAAVMTKHALGAFPPFLLLAFQLALSVPILWLLALSRQRSGPRPPMALSLTGLLNPGLAYALGFAGLALTTAGMSALLWGTEPVLIFLLAHVFLGERHRGLGWWLLAAVTGAALVIGPATGGAMAGNLLVLAGVACCAVYTVINSRGARRSDPLMLATYQQTAALLLVLPLAAIEHEGGLSLPPDVLAWAAAAGLLYYAFAFWLYLIGLRHLPAQRAGLLLNLIPVVGVVTARLALGESLASIQVLGGLLIIGAVGGALTAAGPRSAAALRP